MQEVSLRRCAKLTDDGLAELALGGTLRSLCVAGVPRMGSAGLRALAAACRCEVQQAGIVRVVMGWDKDKACCLLGLCAPRTAACSVYPQREGWWACRRFRLLRRDSLEDLDVSWCRGVSGAWLGVLTDACANLRRLTLFGCTQV